VSGVSSFVPNETLAVNSSADAIESAQRLGFSVLSIETVAGLSLTLTRLQIPPGLDTIAARQLLTDNIQEETFALNNLYRVGGRRCRGLRCYGPKLVRWRRNALCGSGVRAVMLDTGVDVRHKALAGRKINIQSFTPAGVKPSPKEHGTAIAALFTGDAESTTPGLVPNAELFAADVFFTDEEGNPAADTVSMVKGIEWLTSMQVSVINMSLAGAANAALEHAVLALGKKGIIAIAAAGNGGPGAPPRFPAAYSDVIAITAVDHRLRSSPRANRGSYISYAAPGVRLWTAYPDSKAGFRTGTSFAAPFATAIIASIRSGNSQIRTVEDVERTLKARDPGRKGKDPIYGEGLILAPPNCK